MQQLAFYLLKVIACSGLLLLYYRFALRNKRFHYYNRFYLLATIVASLLLPLLNINWFTINSTSDKAIALMNVMYVQGGEVMVDGQSSFFNLTWQQAPAILYTTVCLFFVVVLLRRVYKIYAFKKTYAATDMGEFDFINTDLAQAPFSFLQNLFWRNDIDLNETTGRQILQHELTHIRQKHTWDKLFMQLVLAIFWVNPFYWFIQKELYLLHEFIADEKAIENNDGAAFAAMLLTSQYGKSIFAPAQSFAYSPIKRRLFMLTNLTKPRYSYARRLMVLPLLAGVVMLFAFRLKKAEQITIQDVYIGTAETPGFKVVIDAGHGGTDDGMRINNTTEKDITLRLAQKVKQLSVKYNIDVVLTRNNDAEPMPRERIAPGTLQGAAAFISLHVDYNKDPSQRGISAFISPSNKHYAESRLLGSAVLQNLAGSFTVSPNLKQRQSPIAVLNNNPLPAILLECGMMTNAQDLRNITSDEGITAMAQHILQGIANYANHNVTVQNEVQQQVLYGRHTDTTQPVKITFTTPLILCKPDTIDVSKKPLIIVDNVEDADGLKKVEPADISRIMVLKDGSAIDKYGDKGRNGVIEVFTKEYDAKSIVIEEVKLAEALPVTTNKNAVKSIRLAEVTKNNSAITITGNISMAEAAKNASAITITGKNSESFNLQSKPGGITVAEAEPASFPGGKQAWQQYLSRELKTNIVVDNGGPAGNYTATVSFTVDEQGNLSDFKIVKDPGYGTGAEAVRVIQRGPKWIPAKQDGKPVKVIQQQKITWSVSKG